MAEMLPLLSEDDLKALPSAGEAKVYRWLANLPNTYSVFYGVKWVEKAPGHIMRDREADFVISDSARGLLVIEVKGGGISIEQGKWCTINRFGELALIKDPFEQATSNMYSFVRLLQSLPGGAAASPRVVRSVFFPDVFRVAGLHAANYPPVGSSRVDLQACKLEYSIVSPK